MKRYEAIILLNEILQEKESLLKYYIDREKENPEKGGLQFTEESKREKQKITALSCAMASLAGDPLMDLDQPSLNAKIPTEKEKNL
jgi:hypothetical protein